MSPRSSGKPLGLEGPSDTLASGTAPSTRGYVETLSLAERDQVGAAAARLARQLAAEWPPESSNPDQLDLLALETAAATPDVSDETLLTLGRVSSWIARLASLVADRELPRDELLARTRIYVAVLRDELVETPRDDLALTLGQIRDSLAGYPLWAYLGPEWIAVLLETIDALVQEYAGRRSLGDLEDLLASSLDDYLAHASFRTGVLPRLWATVIALDDASVLSRLESVRLLTQVAATTVCLARELESYRSSAVDQEALNAIALISSALGERGVAAEDARDLGEARLRADVAHGLARLEKLRGLTQTSTGRPEAAILAVTRCAGQSYARQVVSETLADRADARSSSRSARVSALS